MPTNGPGAAGRNAPLCVVAMPRGRHHDAAGGPVDLDAVFTDIVVPAVERAGMAVVRADTATGHEPGDVPVDPRLILCDHAVADLSTADPMICYQVGVRQGRRPDSTVLVYAEGRRPPIEAQGPRVVSYRLTDGVPADPGPAIEAIAAALTANERNPGPQATDAAFFELVDGPVRSDISRTKTDVFRDRVRYAEDVKQRLADARGQGADAVRRIDGELGDPSRVEGPVLIDLMLSYRAVSAWSEVVGLVDRMPPALARSVMVREQRALALNRVGRSEEAEVTLRALLAERGGSSETWALLGRVYKDRWQAAVDAGDPGAPAVLGQAIDAYLAGFEADWRDAYPGINAVTLMELADPPDERREALLPVVRYGVERRLAQGVPDYWDHATLVELAVLARDERAARVSLERALDCVREPWEPESTARNLALVAASRRRRGEAVDWADDIERALADAAAS